MDFIQIVGFFVIIISLLYLLNVQTKRNALDRSQERYPSNLQDDNFPKLELDQKKIPLKHGKSPNFMNKKHSNQFSEYDLRDKKQQGVSTSIYHLQSYKEKKVSNAISKGAVIVKRLHHRRDLFIYQEIMNPPKSMREEI